MPANDLQQMRAIARGDPLAMRRLYDAHAGALFRFAALSLGDRHAAEDVLQETMLAAWAGAERFRGESSVRGWLLGICRKQVAMELRRQKPGDSISISDGPADLREAGRTCPGLAGELREALDELDVERRQLLLLVYVQGLPQQEVAEVLGIPLGTVKSRLFHARRKLRALMEGE
jgi:RNA polymerase sigma-70 factor (ECF subfamily)